MLTNVELLNELPFYNSLNIKEIAEVLKRYSKSFNIEIIDKKDLLTQLYSSKSCIKYLFKVLLCEMKGFKYQITMYITLKRISWMVILNMLMFISIHLLKQ